MNIFDVAEYLFGPMRSSTEEENELIRDMMNRTSRPIGVNVFEMDDGEPEGESEDEDQGLSP